VTIFEVLQHRPAQVRLFPLDERFRSPDRLPGVPTREQWLVIKDRFLVGSEVTATVTGVFPANREYVVRFEDCWSTLEWTGDAPRVGTANRYTVTRHLDQTRRIMITPVTPSQLTKGSPRLKRILGCVAHQAGPMCRTSSGARQARAQECPPSGDARHSSAR
jgi:hypothetical protein